MGHPPQRLEHVRARASPPLNRYVVQSKEPSSQTQRPPGEVIRSGTGSPLCAPYMPTLKGVASSWSLPGLRWCRFSDSLVAWLQKQRSNVWPHGLETPSRRNESFSLVLMPEEMHARAVMSISSLSPTAICLASNAAGSSIGCSSHTRSQWIYLSTHPQKWRKACVRPFPLYLPFFAREGYFMNAELEIARRWIQKARGDLLNADNNLAAEDVPFDTVCFHCQQAAEKILKAFLAGHGTPPPRTHDLLLLLEGIVSLARDAEQLRETLFVLQPYAVEVRYPDQDESPTEADAREAREAAGEVMRWFEQALPEAR